MGSRREVGTPERICREAKYGEVVGRDSREHTVELGPVAAQVAL